MTDPWFTQHTMSLTWDLCKPPVEDAVLDDLERTLGVKLPHDFRELMKLCHGGSPVERSDFMYPDPDYGPVEVCLGALHSVNPDDESSILQVMQRLSREDQLPQGIIPFADDGGGDKMCLDYRDDSDHPRVVYWAHEREKHDSVFPLADSFKEFLDMLEPPSDVTQHVMSLTWELCNPPVEDATLDALERRFGVAFPHDFRELMKLCHGGYPVKRRYFLFPGLIGLEKTSLGRLLALDEVTFDGIVRTAERLVQESELFEGVIPFAHALPLDDDHRVDLVCLDYREATDHPRVVYWTPQRIKWISTRPLADSLTEFLAMLEPPSKRFSKSEEPP